MKKHTNVILLEKYKYLTDAFGVDIYIYMKTLLGLFDIQNLDDIPIEIPIDENPYKCNSFKKKFKNQITYAISVDIYMYI